jgi:hypothetical protein
VFTVTNNGTNNANASGATYVAYLFATTTGFAEFGKYTANGSTDGPFVYTGFKPRFVLIKRTDTTANWNLWDTARVSYNPNNTIAYPNLTNADGVDATANMDILSNGFKLRNTDADRNGSGGTYIYAAFADVPFYYSAQPAASSSGGFVAATAFLMGMTF